MVEVALRRGAGDAWIDDDWNEVLCIAGLNKRVRIRTDRIRVRIEKGRRFGAMHGKRSRRFRRVHCRRFRWSLRTIEIPIFQEFSLLLIQAGVEGGDTYSVSLVKKENHIG